MKKKKVKAEPRYPIVFETFREMGDWEVINMRRGPSCFNGNVSAIKYRITVEIVEEPQDVIAARLEKLWRECDNHHHYQPIFTTAKRLGVDLNPEDYGIDRRRPK